MLSENSKKLKLYKLYNKETGQVESYVYLTESEAESKNRGYRLNGFPKIYTLNTDSIKKD